MPAPDPVLAFDIGGTTVKGALVAGDAVISESRRPTRRGPALLDVVADLADRLVPDGHPRPEAAAVLLPGLVDTATGRSVRAVNLDLEDEPIVGPLDERLGVPVRLGHDVTVTGRLIARDHLAADPLVVVIGTGIASVAFAHGSPVTGTSGQAGELGHVVVEPGGPLCACGARGCLEAVAGAGAISRAYAERTDEQVDAATVLARRSEDPDAAEVWDLATRALADGLLIACTLLAPGVIVLGGGLSEAGAPLVTELDALMREHSHVVTVPEILTTPLGGRAGVLAAAALARGEL